MTRHAYIRRCAAWADGPTDAPTLRARLLAPTPAPPPPCPVAPVRPASFTARAWRRTSRLTRIAITLTERLLPPTFDPEEVGLVWGTGIGEIVPTRRFLDRLFDEGPERASPSAFQNSVYNAPAGHISIGFGLQGPSETVSAGGALQRCGLMFLRCLCVCVRHASV